MPERRPTVFGPPSCGRLLVEAALDRLLAAVDDRLQRVGIESILGLRVEGTSLYLDPCIPRAWAGFELTFRHGSARYEILVENPDFIGRGIASAWLDEQAILEQPLHLPLADDGLTHRLRVRLGQLVPDVSSTQDLRRRS